MRDVIGIKFNKLLVLEFSHSDKNGRYWRCMCDCGKLNTVATKNLTSGQVKSCGCIKNQIMNITGKKFGNLLVIDFAYKKDSRSYWNCICDCGNSKIICGNTITSGLVKSCGCLKLKKLNDISGIKFGKLEAISYFGPSKSGAKWSCICECGKTQVVSGNSLRSGETKSCGCSRRNNMIGRKIGSLSVIKFCDNIKDSSWECKCDCGNITIVKTENLISETTKSCGCMKEYYRKITNNKKYGKDYPMQTLEIALKVAKSSNNSIILVHWKTNEELVCQASYEKAVVEYLNINKINFRWQSKTFMMPNGKTYRPDLYLFSSKKWIEIKGYFRKDAQEKWDWFHKEYPNSELWNKTKLEEIGIL